MSYEGITLTIELTSLQVSIAEGILNFQYLERFVFKLTKAIGQHVIHKYSGSLTTNE